MNRLKEKYKRRRRKDDRKRAILQGRREEGEGKGKRWFDFGLEFKQTSRNIFVVKSKRKIDSKSESFFLNLTF